MILKAKERGDGLQLARYLLAMRDNDHVELHDVRGFTLARGGRRGFVAVDYRGEIYSLTRLTGAKTKDVAARLGDPQKLPSADEARAAMASQMSAQASGLKESAPSKAIEDRKNAWAADMPKDENALWDWLAGLDDASRSSLLAHCVSYGVNALFENSRPDSRYRLLARAGASAREA